MFPVPPVPLAIVAAAIPPAVLSRRLWHQREEPGTRPFVATLLLFVTFDLVYAGSTFIGEEALHHGAFVVLASLLAFGAITWLVFCMEYTGRVAFLTRELIAGLFAIPVLSLVSLVSPLGPTLVIEEYVVVREYGVYLSEVTFGPLGYVAMVVVFGAHAVGLVMLFGFVVSDRRRYSLQASVLALAGAVPVIAALVSVGGISPISPISPTPFAWAIGALVVLLALPRWDLFGFTPATLRVGQAAAFDDLDEAVVIVDDRQRVVDVNTYAADLLGRSAADLVQRPLASALDTEIDVETGAQTVRLETDVGHRNFDVAVSTIDGSWGETIGHTLVLHDVTAEKQRRQRFEVLNRILRHNLRNTMNAVVGYSRELGAEVDGSAEWMVDRIEHQTTNLVELSEKARHIDRVTTPGTDPTTFDVEAGLQRASERLADDRDDVSVTVSAPEGLAVTTHRAVFEEVIRYAADSLVQYNETDDRRIVLSATPTDGERPWISCTITSNGGPIPDDEREVIERGEETPLDHSHDLDLWLVSWGVDTLGGTLRFIAQDDWPGLSLSIPDVQAAREVDGATTSGPGEQSGPVDVRELDGTDERPPPST